jgi:hypothetical protein
VTTQQTFLFFGVWFSLSGALVCVGNELVGVRSRVSECNVSRESMDQRLSPSST